MFELLVLIVVGTSIWVFIDAPARGLSWTWGLGTLALWIVAFPWYLVERQKVSAPRAAPRAQSSAAPSATAGRWEADPRDPTRERWREGERWTQATRRREND